MQDPYTRSTDPTQEACAGSYQYSFCPRCISDEKKSQSCPPSENIPLDLELIRIFFSQIFASREQLELRRRSGFSSSVPVGDLTHSEKLTAGRLRGFAGEKRLPFAEKPKSNRKK